MKELYIRSGNTEETKNFIIVGEESSLGSRDSAYKISKGQLKPTFLDIDKYSKSKELLYNHATPNIKLDTDTFSRDYDVHNLLRESPLFNEIIKWDGESDEGLTQSREVFIPIKYNIQQTCELLYERLESLIHNKSTNSLEPQTSYTYIPLKDYLFGNAWMKYKFSRVSICTKCNGLGKINKRLCNNCRGSGKTTEDLYVNFNQEPYTLSSIYIKEGGNINAFYKHPDLIVYKRIMPNSEYILDPQGDLYKKILIPNMLFRSSLTIDLINDKKIVIQKKDVYDGHLIKISKILPLNHNIYLHLFDKYNNLSKDPTYYVKDINGRRFKTFQNKPDKLFCPKCNSEVKIDDTVCKCGKKLLIKIINQKRQRILTIIIFILGLTSLAFIVFKTTIYILNHYFN